MATSITVEVKKAQPINATVKKSQPIKASFVKTRPIEVEITKAGMPGVGVPPGGAPGTALTKLSGDNYDTGWIAAASTDKHYSEAFTMQSYLVINHNLGKRPAVTIVDTANDEVIGLVTHLTVNSLMVEFNAATSGIIICN